MGLSQTRQIQFDRGAVIRLMGGKFELYLTLAWLLCKQLTSGLFRGYLIVEERKRASDKNEA